MANSWLRLWHDMPNDPKWRTIARISGEPISLVQAIYLHLLVDASRNVTRGHTEVTNEDLASALDCDESQIGHVRDAMQGRVLDGFKVSGWETRQPKREENGDPNSGAKSPAQRKREERQRKKQADLSRNIHDKSRQVTTESRNVTTDKDKDKDKELNIYKFINISNGKELPADSELSIELAGRAAEYWLEIGREDLDSFEEFEKFKAHHRSHKQVMADWEEAWVAWFMNAPRFNKPRYISAVVPSR